MLRTPQVHSEHYFEGQLVKYGQIGKDGRLHVPRHGTGDARASLGRPLLFHAVLTGE
jgi:hypothetical protein